MTIYCVMTLTFQSYDIIDHVTIRFATCHFLLVVHWIQAYISSRFRDNGLQTY